LPYAVKYPPEEEKQGKGKDIKTRKTGAEQTAENKTEKTMQEQ